MNVSSDQLILLKCSFGFMQGFIQNDTTQLYGDDL